ncbi:uncharacterized protein WM277_025460 [Molossus nigricans]
MAAQHWTGRPLSPPLLFCPTRFHLRCLPCLPSHPSSASRVLPGWVRNCSWRNRGTPKPANGKRRDAEIGSVDGKVGGKESGGARLSIKMFLPELILKEAKVSRQRVRAGRGLFQQKELHGIKEGCGVSMEQQVIQFSQRGAWQLPLSRTADSGRSCRIGGKLLMRAPRTEQRLGN